MSAAANDNLVLKITADTARAVAGMSKFLDSLKATAKGATGTGTAFATARATMTQYVAQAQRTGATVTRAMSGIGIGTERAMSVARKALASVGPVAEKSFGAMKVAAMGARLVLGQMLGPLGSILKIGSLISGAVGGLSIAGGFAMIAKTGVDMIATLKGAEMTLTSILGSRGAATQFVKALEQEAASSLPTFKELLPAAVQLAQVYGPAGLGKVIPTIRAFGDAATVAAGGDTEALSRALAQFRQLVTRDNPTMEDLGLIGENLGVNVRDIIKQQFGTADMETLGKAGVTGMMIGDALVAGFQKKFGGAQVKGATGSIGGLFSGISDAFNSLAAAVTGGLYGSIMKSLTGILDFLKGIQESATGKVILESLAAVMTAMGRGMELAAKQAQPFLEWLSKVATAKNVTLFLENVLALMLTIGQTVLQVFGVDLQKAMDPKNVTGWFEALGLATAGAINTVFGLGRVFVEVRSIIGSAIQDLSDRFHDFAFDAEISFGRMVQSMRRSIHGAVASMIGSFVSLADGLNGLLGRLGLDKIDVGSLLDAQASQVGSAMEAGGQLAKYNEQELAERRFRSVVRPQQRMKDDPRRNMSPGDRISGAFAGTAGDRAAQDAFWERFAGNRLNIAKGLFAGSAAKAPVSPTGAGIQLYGAGTRTPPTVTTSTVGVTSPTPAVPAMPAGDPFAPVTLPDGRVVSAFAAEQMGLSGGGGSPTLAGAPKVRQTATGTSITLNFNGVQNAQQLKDLIMRVIDQEGGKVFAGPTGY